MKHWPVVLALVLVLIAGIVAVRRRTPENPSTPPAAGSTTETPIPAAGAGQNSQGPPPLLPPVQPREMGSLKCVLMAETGAIRGIVVVLDDGDRREALRPASGEGRVEILIDQLTTGPKRAVYLPEQAHAAVTAQATVSASAVAEVTMLLKAVGTLKGKVVDSLQRPLPSATVEIAHPALFAPRRTGKPPVDVWGEGGGRSGGRAGTTRVPISYSRSLNSDGILRASISTDSDGEFELEGVSLPSVEIHVKYKEVRVTRACTRDGENLLIVPVVLEAPVRDLKAEAILDSIQNLQKQMAVHHDNPEPYAAQLRELLRRVVSEADLTPKQREELHKHIEAIGRSPR